MLYPRHESPAPAHSLVPHLPKSGPCSLQSQCVHTLTPHIRRLDLAPHPHPSMSWREPLTLTGRKGQKWESACQTRTPPENSSSFPSCPLSLVLQGSHPRVRKLKRSMLRSWSHIHREEESSYRQMCLWGTLCCSSHLGLSWPPGCTLQIA